MNILACDLCRNEIAQDSPRASFVIVLHAQPKAHEYVIRDVCERCLESATSFLDGLRTGPPGESLMIPKDIYTGPAGSGAGE